MKQALFAVFAQENSGLRFGALTVRKTCLLDYRSPDVTVFDEFFHHEAPRRVASAR